MFVLTEKNSIANVFLAELRDKNIQKDAMRFRRNLERLGELFAYEISKTFEYVPTTVQTPLGEKQTMLLGQAPVLATVLRAALPLFNGFLNVFDNAECAFVGAYRGAHRTDNSFDIEVHYTTVPNLNGKPLILIDPMLATGKSIVQIYEKLLQCGTPSHVHIVAAIASKDGIEYVKKHVKDVSIWIGDIDEILNEKSYIIPGLGDAVDLAFGIKL